MRAAASLKQELEQSGAAAAAAASATAAAAATSRPRQQGPNAVTAVPHALPAGGSPDKAAARPVPVPVPVPMPVPLPVEVPVGLVPRDTRRPQPVPIDVPVGPVPVERPPLPPDALSAATAASRPDAPVAESALESRNTVFFSANESG